jgi:hypothetical protein
MVPVFYLISGSIFYFIQLLNLISKSIMSPSLHLANCSYVNYRLYTIIRVKPDTQNSQIGPKASFHSTINMKHTLSRLSEFLVFNSSQK